MDKDNGAPVPDRARREPREPYGLGPSGFDPSRLRAIPIWMVGAMTPGWHEQGTSAYQGADAIVRLEAALNRAVDALRTVGNDYPGSSCQLFCHEEAESALQIAAGVK